MSAKLATSVSVANPDPDLPIVEVEPEILPWDRLREAYIELLRLGRELERREFEDFRAYFVSMDDGE